MSNYVFQVTGAFAEFERAMIRSRVRADLERAKLPVKAVERSDVARVMREVAADRTAKDEKTKRQGRRILRGGWIVANRVQALLSKRIVLTERFAQLHA